MGSTLKGNYYVKSETTNDFMLISVSFTLENVGTFFSILKIIINAGDTNPDKYMV